LKYNLKNRPKICHGNIDYLDEETECQKWFEGFEAELREQLRQLMERPSDTWIVAERRLIKKILGE